MATVKAFILARIQSAGFGPDDLSSIRFWNDKRKVWRSLGVHQVLDAFEAVQVSDVHADVRERLEFTVESESGENKVFAWDSASSNFEVVPDDSAFMLTSQDLTG